jgi:outer membrane protein assembly factor BamB
MLRARKAFVLALLATPLLAGCARISSPDGWASPEIVEDTIFISLENGEISALDAGDFAEQWTFPASDEATCPGREGELDLDGIYGAPAVGDEVVYIGA